MGVAAEIDIAAFEDVVDVVGVRGIDLGVFGGGKIVNIIAAYCLIQKWQAD